MFKIFFCNKWFYLRKIWTFVKLQWLSNEFLLFILKIYTRKSLNEFKEKKLSKIDEEYYEEFSLDKNFINEKKIAILLCNLNNLINNNNSFKLKNDNNLFNNPILLKIFNLEKI